MGRGFDRAWKSGMSQESTHSHNRIRRLVVYLIKPSKYDDDGYVIRYWRGVLPSNTLTCLYGLTVDVKERGALGASLSWRIEVLDETVQRVDVARIVRAGRSRKTKVVVCLVGVQSNQFARALDLSLTLRGGGIDVLIGGFHVSGSLAMMREMSSEIQQLLAAGVTIVAGEIEGRWENLLRDALEGNLKPIYHFLQEPPSLHNAPMPRIPPGYLGRFVAPNFATLDCGRGCPFNCSFCTVINVQGRTMRFREVNAITQWIRENYRRGILAYFFTDDNFCRHPHWEQILDALIELREREGIRITFMVQADTQSYKLPNFISKAHLAGCAQVFIGLESLNTRNLEAAGKMQNRIEAFRTLIEAYRQGGINTHIAYIIGFPFDTPESVQQDIRRLTDELGPEQASFFMLTPLPGSRDHLMLVSQGIAIDDDLNRYDSFHATTEHPRMSRAAWQGAYQEAWKRFYSVSNMVAILKRVSPQNYWSVFANFIWYKHSIMVEDGHPMIHGFIRLKAREERRSSMPLETRWRYLKRRGQDILRYARLWPRLALEMEEVWLQTRHRSAFEQHLIEELRRLPSSIRGWRRMRTSEIQAAYQRTAETLRWRVPVASHDGSINVPARLWLWIHRWNPFWQTLTYSRHSLTRFWRRCASLLKRGRLDRLPISTVGFHATQEVVLFGTFVALFFTRLLHRLLARRGFIPRTP